MGRPPTLAAFVFGGRAKRPNKVLKRSADRYARFWPFLAGPVNSFDSSENGVTFHRAETATGPEIDNPKESAPSKLARGYAQLVALAAQHSKPVVYYARAFAVAGGLLSYASSFTDSFYQAATCVGRILKGEKPVVYATKFDLAINVKTANLLLLKFPLTLQVAADEVIE